ncbi:pilus assembly protein N-terminal domain-containing protein [Budvicia aquatica]|uniref:Flp pilus assembly protein, secretin CpaC n=1 Tax=Budvicia aquatica TaxID=82979 RepID=A0A484ZJX4_9GAMM|nr:pilus assembly protein N-terminal domain-containing protein [Budvicia aquatica]VFS48724.1 Flp pilus assembly protein, secretin CpaC [Budvicia aquatica]
MCQRNYIWQVCILASAFFINTAVFAEQLYLKPGMSKQINTRDSIKTVFISSPEIADYKVIGNKSVVLYGKKSGSAEISVYGANSKVIYNVSLGVDPLLPSYHSVLGRNIPAATLSLNVLMITQVKPPIY